jgi:hypothetical protein
MMSERNLLRSVSHVTAHAKSHNNISIYTKLRINLEVALHDVKFGLCCAHELIPGSYVNFEIFFFKCVRLRGKIYSSRKTGQQMAI